MAEMENKSIVLIQVMCQMWDKKIPNYTEYYPISRLIVQKFGLNFAQIIKFCIE